MYPRRPDVESDTALSSIAEPALLEVEALAVTYTAGWRKQPVQAVDDVSFVVGRGETVGIVGESGSGKSTIGRAILGLVAPAAGRIVFDGREITRLSYRQRRRLSADLQAVFQDPNSSLNPTRTIGQTLGETLLAQGRKPRENVRRRVAEMLVRVGLSPDVAHRYPATFSGGQRQRIAIARALMASPTLIVYDEPLSALDLSVQAQILNLLRELQREFGLAYVFIAHDLAVVRHISHRVIVLYRGRVMEHGSADEIYSRPRHPYTQSLLAAAPVPDAHLQKQRRLTRVSARVASSDAAVAPGCPFAPRCVYAEDRCYATRPSSEMTPAGSEVSCHRWRELASAVDLPTERPAVAPLRTESSRRHQ